MTIPAGPDELDAAWIEDALRGGGALPDARVRSVSAEIIGVGFGLDGTCARVTIDGDGVPATLVAKWTKSKDAARETLLYRDIAPRLPLDLATLFSARTDYATGRALLLLSDVSPAKQGDSLIGATADEAAALTDAMAGFHAVFWGEADAPLLATLPRWIDDGERRARRVREAVPRFLVEWEGRLPRAALAIAAELPERVLAAHAALAAAPVTLVHADLHLDNVMFRPSGVPVILDWTDASRGPGAVDFARLFVEGMTSPVRRVQQQALTVRYAEALAARGVAGYGVERTRADVTCVTTILFADAVRWAAGPDPLGPDVPRVAAIVESLVRQTADAAAEATG